MLDGVDDVAHLDLQKMEVGARLPGSPPRPLLQKRRQDAEACFQAACDHPSNEPTPHPIELVWLKEVGDVDLDHGRAFVEANTHSLAGRYGLHDVVQDLIEPLLIQYVHGAEPFVGGISGNEGKYKRHSLGERLLN